MSAELKPSEVKVLYFKRLGWSFKEIANRLGLKTYQKAVYLYQHAIKTIKKSHLQNPR